LAGAQTRAGFEHMLQSHFNRTTTMRAVKKMLISTGLKRTPSASVAMNSDKDVFVPGNEEVSARTKYPDVPEDSPKVYTES